MEKGLALLIKRGDGGGPETFTAVAGLRSKQIDIDNEEVDVSNDDSVNRMRELLAGAGFSSISVSGSGVVKNNADLKAMVDDAKDMVHTNYEIVVPGIGTFTGPFQLKMGFAGETNGESTWNISLASAGDVTFAAVA